MAVNFGLIAQAPSLGQSFVAGQQAAQQEVERNRLRQVQDLQLVEQRENALALRQKRLLDIDAAKSKEAAAARRQQFLSNLGAKMAEGGYKLDRPSLGSMLQFGMETGEDMLVKLATEGLRALDDEDLYRSELAKLTGGETPEAPAAAAPAVAAPAAAPGGARPVRTSAAATPEQIKNMLLSPSPRIREQGKILANSLAKEPTEVAAMNALGFPLTPEGYEQFRRTQRQERLLTPEEEAQRIRIAAAGAAAAAARGAGTIDKVITDVAGRVTLLDKRGNVIEPSAPVQGKPSATFEKSRAQREQLSRDLNQAITELTSATTKGGLIDQSTGSGVGRLIDVGAGFVGQATPGAVAAARLAPIADMVLKMVPRFEGPQSDKDTQSYKEAAGQLSNSSLPNEVRKQAALEILRIMKARKDQFVTPAMAAEGTPPREPAAAPRAAPAAPAATKSGATVSNWYSTPQ
jgi:hypothetical protein